MPTSVTNLAGFAFLGCTGLTNVTIPKSLTHIARGPFVGCTSLNAITVDGLNAAYISVDGVLFNKSKTTLIQYPGGKAGGYTVPSTVTNIGDYAFEMCPILSSVTIPNSVSSIGDEAFYSCTGLTGVTVGIGVASIGIRGFDGCASLNSLSFRGNAPTLASPFGASTHPTIYYFPGATGWGSTFGGRPTMLWNPQMQTGGASFGLRTNRFGFTTYGTSNLVLVVESCTNLDHPAWSVVGTNTLTGGSSYFSDPRWTNYPARFYRLRSP